MFSKNVLKTMVQELSLPTLAAMGQEAMGKIGAVELDGKAVELLENVELIVGEIRRRAPQEAAQGRKRNKTQEGGEQNG